MDYISILFKGNLSQYIESLQYDSPLYILLLFDV